MTCADVQKQLTAYLDGELDADRGSVVRGHLRECAACRQVAGDEAALRDGLRQLPPVDPPPSLWAGVQARLAEAEVADSRRPAWRRALARWAPFAPRYAAVTGLAAAAAATIVWYRAHRAEPVVDDHAHDRVVEVTRPTVAPPTVTGPTQVVVASSGCGDAAPEADVTADLQAETARISATYGCEAEDLLARAAEVRPEWSTDQRAAFDARVAELRAAVEHADEGRPRQRAWRSLIRYLHNAVVRDEIALAGGAP